MTYPYSPKASSILSHSSRIKCLMCLRLSVLLLARALMRPGVPTTMCGQFFLSTSSSRLMDRPPKNTATFTLLVYLLKRSYSLLIWKASSRVWHKTSTETCRDDETWKPILSQWPLGDVPVILKMYFSTSV